MKHTFLAVPAFGLLVFMSAMSLLAFNSGATSSTLTHAGDGKPKQHWSEVERKGFKLFQEGSQHILWAQDVELLYSVKILDLNVPETAALFPKEDPQKFHRDLGLLPNLPSKTFNGCRIYLVGLFNSELYIPWGRNSRILPIHSNEKARMEEKAWSVLTPMMASSGVTARQREGTQPAESEESSKAEAGGIQRNFLSTDDSSAVDQVTGILYKLSPNELTALGALTGEGLVLMDQLGGNEGLEVLTSLPLTTMSITKPRDFEAFSKIVVSNIIEPSKQVDLLGTLTLQKLNGYLGGVAELPILTSGDPFTTAALSKRLREIPGEDQLSMEVEKTLENAKKTLRALNRDRRHLENPDSAEYQRAKQEVERAFRQGKKNGKRILKDLGS